MNAGQTTNDIPRHSIWHLAGRCLSSQPKEGVVYSNSQTTNSKSNEMHGAKITSENGIPLALGSDAQLNELFTENIVAKLWAVAERLLKDQVCKICLSITRNFPDTAHRMVSWRSTPRLSLKLERGREDTPYVMRNFGPVASFQVVCIPFSKGP